MAKKNPSLSTPELAELMARLKEDIKGLTEKYDAYAATLLAQLQHEGRKREGRFSIAQRQTLKILDAAKADEWAKNHSVMKFDTAKAMRVLRRELQVPPFFEVQHSDYLTTAGSSRE